MTRIIGSIQEKPRIFIPTHHLGTQIAGHDPFVLRKVRLGFLREYSFHIHFIPLKTRIFQKFTEVWTVDPEKIESEGTYEVQAIFIASGLEISKEFEIKFAV